MLDSYMFRVVKGRSRAECERFIDQLLASHHPVRTERTKTRGGTTLCLLLATLVGCARTDRLSSDLPPAHWDPMYYKQIYALSRGKGADEWPEVFLENAALRQSNARFWLLVSAVLAEASTADRLLIIERLGMDHRNFYWCALLVERDGQTSIYAPPTELLSPIRDWTCRRGN